MKLTIENHSKIDGAGEEYGFVIGCCSQWPDMYMFRCVHLATGRDYLVRLSRDLGKWESVNTKRNRYVWFVDENGNPTNNAITMEGLKDTKNVVFAVGRELARIIKNDLSK